MKRDIYRHLAAWKINKYRKPLILKGARQTGKTFILKEFAKEYHDSVYINFEETPSAKLTFSDSLSPAVIIENLEIQLNVRIQPEKTLVILDEIQECPNALNCLKYFNESANEYHIVSAGSLLGVKIKKRKINFPVGKVTFLEMKPLSFFEFLDALNENRLRQKIENVNSFEPLNEALHQKAISLLKKYYFIGGMPEAVQIYANEKNYDLVGEVHKSILDAYVLDFTKYATPSEVMKIMSIWNSIPNQLAKENKKFIFQAVRKSARSREYESSIQWLTDAGLINKVYHVSKPGFPLDSYADKSAFKIYMLDTGLLCYMSRLPVQMLLQANQLFVEFKGALTENYAIQELLANIFEKIYYWTSTGMAEVDIVVQNEMNIYPIEVKPGLSRMKKSLLVYGNKYNPDILSRTTLMNLKRDGNICNYPLYMIGVFPIS